MAGPNSSQLRCVYCDLDGTLLGRGGSLFADSDGKPTAMGARAVEACLRADVELVIYTGRNRRDVFELARLFGQRSFIYEAGCGIVIDGEEEFLTDEIVAREDASIHDQIAQSGAPDQLLGHYRGALEYHDPWHHNREISHLFRGGIAVEEADAFLTENGHPGLRLVDNGVISHRSPTLNIEGNPHAYHLIPRGASKARAVARHMQNRGYAPETCIAIGDSREDLGAAEVLGTFWLVANALQRDPSLQAVVENGSNIRLTEATNGAGVYEAVITTLAQ